MKSSIKSLLAVWLLGSAAIAAAGRMPARPLDLRAKISPALSPQVRRIVDELQRTQDPNRVHPRLRSFSMRIRFDGVLFRKFAHSPGMYADRDFAVTSYPKDQTSIWHDFPTPGHAVVYSRLPTGEEKLVFVRLEHGRVVVERHVDEPLDNLAVQYERGATVQQLKILKELGGRAARRKGATLTAMFEGARAVDRTFGTGFAPKKGHEVSWSTSDVAAFFGQALNKYDLGAYDMTSPAATRVALVRKRRLGKGTPKSDALEVTYAEGMRVNPGKGGKMIHLQDRDAAGGLRTGTLHYAVPFMTGGDEFLRAHQTVSDYRPVADGDGFQFPHRRQIQFYFKGDKEGVRFPGQVELDAPYGIDATFADVRASLEGAPRTVWDDLVQALQRGELALPPAQTARQAEIGRAVDHAVIDYRRRTGQLLAK